jgi:hypothetical protein
MATTWLGWGSKGVHEFKVYEFMSKERAASQTRTDFELINSPLSRSYFFDECDQHRFDLS